MKKKYSGFTLSEVLIALTIIGVISALSIPALLRSSNDEKLRAAYKKAFSQANQAIYAAGDDTAATMTTTMGCSMLATCSTQNDTNFNALRAQFKVIRTCPSGNAAGCWSNANPVLYANHTEDDSFVSADGMYWIQHFSTIPLAVFSVDVNGQKGPNTLGRDIFPLEVRGPSGRLPDRIDPMPDETAVSIRCPSPPCLYTSALSGS